MSRQIQSIQINFRLKINVGRRDFKLHRMHIDETMRNVANCVKCHSWENYFAEHWWPWTVSHPGWELVSPKLFLGSTASPARPPPCVLLTLSVVRMHRAMCRSCKTTRQFKTYLASMLAIRRESHEHLRIQHRRMRTRSELARPMPWRWSRTKWMLDSLMVQWRLVGHCKGREEDVLIGESAIPSNHFSSLWMFQNAR